MIAVSSFRRLDDSPEYAANQIRALKSWKEVFRSIVFFNRADERMNGDNVYFVGLSDDPPQIKLMAAIAGNYNEPAVLLNADIVVQPKLKAVHDELIQRGAKCAISRRFQFDPKEPAKPAKNVDLGLDYFWAQPEVWRRVDEEIPEDYVIGSPLYDTWLCTAFSRWHADACYDISMKACILHPAHEGRKYQPVTSQVPDPAWPKLYLNP